MLENILVDFFGFGLHLVIDFGFTEWSGNRDPDVQSTLRLNVVTGFLNNTVTGMNMRNTIRRFLDRRDIGFEIK